MNRLQTIIFWGILVVAVVIRVLPLIGHNFYFTMDQGNDAVHVRDILVGHKIALLGPETSIFGLYAGPLWYYFIALGYAITGGDPFGAVLPMIVLNIFLVAWIMKRLSREVSPWFGLFVGAYMQISWWFFDTSRYGFNPFPMVFISFWIVFWLIDAWRGQSKYFLLTALPIGLAFHTDVATSITATAFYFLVLAIAWFKKKIQFKQILFAAGLVGLFLIPHAISELTSNFAQTKTLIRAVGDPSGVFASSLPEYITNRYILVISRTTYRQIPELGLLFLIITLAVFFGRHKHVSSYKHSMYFIILTATWTIISWAFFVTNEGWRDWQTAFLSPLILLSFLQALPHVPKKLAILLMCISLYSHSQIFLSRYKDNWKISTDQSILANEMQAVDWTYQQAKGEGFAVYSYLPSVFDYPYQYLYWWQGLKKYKYLPCEYSTYPGAPKAYLKDLVDYKTPTKTCSGMYFLIIEPDKNEVTRQTWITSLIEKSELIRETNIGNILVQQRKKN